MLAVATVFHAKHPILTLLTLREMLRRSTTPIMATLTPFRHCRSSTLISRTAMTPPRMALAVQVIMIPTVVLSRRRFMTAH